MKSGARFISVSNSRNESFPSTREKINCYWDGRGMEEHEEGVHNLLVGMSYIAQQFMSFVLQQLRHVQQLRNFWSRDGLAGESHRRRRVC